MSVAEDYVHTPGSWTTKKYRAPEFISKPPSGDRHFILNAPPIPTVVHGAANSLFGNVFIAPRHQAESTVLFAKNLIQRNELLAAMALQPLGMDEATIKTSVLIIQSLDPMALTPNVMPDSEGGAILYWGSPASVMITIDGDKVSPTISPGRQEAKYLPEEVFDGGLAEAVVNAIPTVINSQISGF